MAVAGSLPIFVVNSRLLSALKKRSTLWIHLRVNKVSVISQPDFVGANDDRIAIIIAADPIFEYPHKAYAAIASDRGYVSDTVKQILQ